MQYAAVVLARASLVGLAFLVVTLAQCPVHAGDAAYRECDVFNGHKTWCGTSRADARR